MTLSAPAAAGFIYDAGGPEAAYFTIAGLNIAAVLLTYMRRDADLEDLLQEVAMRLVHKVETHLK